MAQAKMPGPFLLQFFCEARVPFCGRNRHGEGNQVEPSPNCLIDIPKARPVVSGDNELEGRLVGEEVLAHEPGGDRVTASQSLNLGLRPVMAVLCFLGGDKTSASQHRE